MINESILNGYYGKIANELNELIPVKLNKIIMYGEELGDVSSVSFYFYNSEENQVHYSGNIPEDFSVSRDIFKRLLRELRGSIRDLWNEFKNAEQETWSTITFVLEKDWKFKVKYEYDLNNKVGPFEREIIWAYNEIGLIPNGEFAKEILEEYLREQGKSL